MESTFSLDKVPLAALRNATRGIVSSLLNPCKVLPSPSKYPRDFRGLAYLADLPLPPCNCHDPTAAVLESWEKERNPTVAEFIGALELIDRWDVIDDVKEFVEKDVQGFFKGATALEKPPPSQISDSDNHILTIDDVLRIEKGLEPQFYDAFLLYSDDDVEFATQMIDRLEQQYNMKLCIKDRDLVGGVTFEHEAIMRLISERCKRLIIIISQSFIESPANKFFVTYAQALGIEQRQRKIIPCTYKDVRLPPSLAYYFVLHFTRSSPLWNFWDQLSASVRSPLPGVTPVRNALPSTVRITELPASEWDCPEKKPPQSRRSLPSTVEEPGASSSRTVSETAVTVPSASDENFPSPSAPSETSDNLQELITKSAKSKSKSLSSLLPSPPSGRLKKMAWWKTKKKKAVPSQR